MEMTNLSWFLLIFASIAFTLAFFFGLNYQKASSEIDKLQQKSESLQLELQNLSNQLARVSSELESEKRISQEKLEQFNESKHQLTEQFKFSTRYFRRKIPTLCFSKSTKP